MRTAHIVALASGLLLTSSLAHADGPVTREYSREGEISPGTKAPSSEAMVKAIAKGSPVSMRAALEYGERVRCDDCVSLLSDKLLSSGDAGVREMSAWWLRRQPFAARVVLAKMRKVVKSDGDAVQRARAAAALGELMDPHALPELTDAALEDKEPEVRAAAARALSRINSEGTGATFADVLTDKAREVKLAALDVLLTVRSFRDYTSLLPLLGDKDTDVRARSARLCGELRLRTSESTLIELLSDDSSRVRTAAAWALGRVGGAAGQKALAKLAKSEKDERVLDAVDVAQRMPVLF